MTEQNVRSKNPNISAVNKFAKERKNYFYKNSLLFILLLNKYLLLVDHLHIRTGLDINPLVVWDAARENVLVIRRWFLAIAELLAGQLI